MKDIGAIHRNIASAIPKSDVLTKIVGWAALIIPQQISGCGIPGLDVVAFVRVSNVHDTVAHERSNLLGAFVHSPHPGQLELMNIVSIDLVQWAEGLEVVSPMYH